MTKPTGETAGNPNQSAADDIRKAFSGLPLDQQFATLIRIELDMLGEAAEYVVSAVTNAVDEIANACSKSSTAGNQNPGSQPSAS